MDLGERPSNRPGLATRTAMAQVEIYTTRFCGFCHSAKALLTRKGIKFLEIDVSGDLAYAHWIQRFTGPEKDHPAQQMWLRITGCYKRSGGTWRIVHEHVSVPFDPMSGKAVLSPDSESRAAA